MQWRKRTKPTHTCMLRKNQHITENRGCGEQVRAAVCSHLGVAWRWAPIERRVERAECRASRASPWGRAGGEGCGWGEREDEKRETRHANTAGNCAAMERGRVNGGDGVVWP